MGVAEDICRCSVLAEHAQDFLHRAALLGASVEFAVGVSARAALAKGVVALGVHDVAARDLREVALALMHVLTALHYDGAKAQFNQTQGGKQSARTGTNDDDLRPAFHIGIVHRLEGSRCHGFVNPYAHAQVHEHLALSRIYTAAHNPITADAPRRHTAFGHHLLAKQRIGGGNLRKHPKLKFTYHCGTKITLFCELQQKKEKNDERIRFF